MKLMKLLNEVKMKYQYSDKFNLLINLFKLVVVI